MVTRDWQPDRGDFVFLDFTPHAGTEQAGRRPALILSPRRYNIATGLAAVCPVTSQVKGSVWEVIVPPGQKIAGAVLSNQFRSVDWLARRAEFHSRAPDALVATVMGRIKAILED